MTVSHLSSFIDIVDIDIDIGTHTLCQCLRQVQSMDLDFDFVCQAAKIAPITKPKAKPKGRPRVHTAELRETPAEPSSSKSILEAVVNGILGRAKPEKKEKGTTQEKKGKTAKEKKATAKGKAAKGKKEDKGKGKAAKREEKNGKEKNGKEKEKGKKKALEEDNEIPQMVKKPKGKVMRIPKIVTESKLSGSLVHSATTTRAQARPL